MIDNNEKKTLGWTSYDDGQTFSARKSKEPVHKDLLPSGYYSIGYHPFLGIVFETIDLKNQNLIKVGGTKTDRIIQEITKFWERRELFDKYQFPYKRGILMHGPPGCGKSCTIALLAEEVTKMNGICLKFMKTNLLKSAMELIRSNQPEVPILVVMEDLDQLIRYNNMSDFLNMLDGVGDSAQNVIYLATTNNPGALHENIRNRPSRFDKRIHFGPPEDILRKAYIENLFEKDATIPIDVNQWVADSAGLSFAHLKELFVSNVLFGNDYSATLSELKTMGAAEEEDQIDFDLMDDLDMQEADLLDANG